VHDHEGHILVDTAPGRGACFRVLLPPMTDDAGGEAVRAKTLPSSPGRQLRGRVLLVDDEPAVGEFMAELLISWGLEVVVERNPLAAQGLFAANTNQFDLVVTDQTMPKLNGLDLARRLLDLRPGLPIVLYSGYADRVTETHTRGSGIRAFVTKPIDVGTFFALLAGILKKPKLNTPV
jgi:CheY-like chemotaxis protein